MGNCGTPGGVCGPVPDLLRPDGNPWGWGCGDAGSDRFVPDSVDGVSFLGACRKHDACYEKCGASKQQCDEDFHESMVDACFASGRPVGLCLLGATTYKQAMSTRTSKAAFDRAQSSCECQR